MLKKQTHLFAALLWLFDMAMLAGSFVAAYLARFFLPALFPPSVYGPSSLQDSVTLFLLAVPVWTVSFQVTGLYGVRRRESRASELVGLLRGTALALLLLVFTQYFSGAERYSRGVILIFAVLSFLLLATTRMVARGILARLRMKGFQVSRALVLGDNTLGAALVQRLKAHPEYGVEVVEVLSASAERVGQQLEGVPVRGVYEDVNARIAETGALQVYLALEAEEHARQNAVLELMRPEFVDVRVVPDVMDLVTLRGSFEEMDGLPIVSIQAGPLMGVDAALKRAFDLAFATLFLVAFSPLMLFCALMVKLSSPGPVFYKQERMGLDGKVFHILKFRSMPVNAETSTGAVWAKAGENRAFPFGAVMRKYSLDEFPQFINVLLGDMSIVGPRPERPVFIQDFKHRIPRYNLRHKMKAGVTGLAQVEGWRGNTSLEKRIERDLWYIEHWSLWLDFKIVLRTAFGGFLSRNAY